MRWVRHDLPTGAPRWDQAVGGYRMTLVSGVVTWEGGAHTGALPGTLVRNPGAVASAVATEFAEVPAAFRHGGGGGGAAGEG